jgi:hypothetical protein
VDRFHEAARIQQFVIPGRGQKPGIHNPEPWLWIPGMVNREVNAAMAKPESRQRMREDGLLLHAMDAAAFRKFSIHPVKTAG